ARLEPLAALAPRHVPLCEAGGLPGADGQRARLELAPGEEGLEFGVDPLDLDAEAPRHDAHRLREADVPRDAAAAAAFVERLGRVGDSDPAEHGLAEAREVDDALDQERLDLRHGAARGEDERVEGEAGVEPGAEDRDALRACERV